MLTYVLNRSGGYVVAVQREKSISLNDVRNTLGNETDAITCYDREVKLDVTIAKKSDGSYGIQLNVPTDRDKEYVHVAFFDDMKIESLEEAARLLGIDVDEKVWEKQ